jgi:hypothetical protein
LTFCPPFTFVNPPTLLCWLRCDPLRIALVHPVNAGLCSRKKKKPQEKKGKGVTPSLSFQAASPFRFSFFSPPSWLRLDHCEIKGYPEPKHCRAFKCGLAPMKREREAGRKGGFRSCERNPPFLLTPPPRLPLLLFTPGTSTRAFTVFLCPLLPKQKKSRGFLGFLPGFVPPVHAGPAPPTPGTLPHVGPLGDATQAPASCICRVNCMWQVRPSRCDPIGRVCCMY